jgi:hypothetical protein
LRFIIFDPHPEVPSNPSWVDRILCLANSYKHDHRCVAGISLITKQWVRLVGRQVPGCLTRHEAAYADGKEVSPLDIFEADLGEKCGSNCHPEDVYVIETPWRRAGHFNELHDAHFLTAYVQKEPIVLQGYCDRVLATRFDRTPAACSLGLVHPEDMWWWIRDENGKRRNRAVFRLGRVGRIRYDLPVTDPAWLDMLNLLPAGIYPHTFFFKDNPVKTYLTVSLSEPFEGFQYKLVAGVVNIRV